MNKKKNLGVMEEEDQINENLARKYCRAILEGLSYLHSEDIVHGDLKCANVLVTVDGVPKIADFGSAF